MALKIRLQRHGASHRPFYRMVVTEADARRDGRFVEVLGTYEPQAKRSEDELKLKLDRVDYWKSVGAKPTDTAASLVRRARRSAPAESESAAAAPAAAAPAEAAPAAAAPAEAAPAPAEAAAAPAEAAAAPVDPAAAPVDPAAEAPAEAAKA